MDKPVKAGIGIWTNIYIIQIHLIPSENQVKNIKQFPQNIDKNNRFTIITMLHPYHPFDSIWAPSPHPQPTYSRRGAAWGSNSTLGSKSSSWSSCRSCTDLQNPQATNQKPSWNQAPTQQPNKVKIQSKDPNTQIPNPPYPNTKNFSLNASRSSA